jgi:hypothetical protein
MVGILTENRSPVDGKAGSRIFQNGSAQEIDDPGLDGEEVDALRHGCPVLPRPGFRIPA